MYVLKSDIERYGETDGCPGCARVFLAGKTTVPHSEECRARIVELMARDEDAGVQVRYHKHLARHDKAPETEETKDPEVPGSPDLDDPMPEGTEAERASGKTVRFKRPLEEPQPEEAPNEPGSSSSGPGPPKRPEPEVPAELDPDDRPEEPKRSKNGHWKQEGNLWKKRQAEEASTDLRDRVEREDEGEHVDADVKIPQAVVREMKESPAADAADAPREADASAISEGKAEMLPMLERQLARAFRQQGMDADTHDVEEMAICLCELSACDVHELFTPRKFNVKKTQAYGLRPGFCMDLTSENLNGDTWDISKRHDEEMLRKVQDKEKPTLLIGSLPSNIFNPIVWPSSCSRTGISDEEVESCERLLYDMCQKQLEAGRHFVCEVPSKAEEPGGQGLLRKLESDSRVRVVRGCEFRARHSSKAYIRSRSTWITSSEEVANSLRNFACQPSGSQRQAVRCGDTVVLQYPAALLKDIFKATLQQIREDRGAHGMCSYDAGPIPDEDDRVFMKKQEELIGEYWDDVNGGWLDTEKVRKARKEELDWILKQNVFSKVPASEVEGRLLSLRWIDTVKSDGRYRSRLVVREIKKAKKEDEKLDPADVFSSMPPVEGLKSLISHMMTEQKDPDGENLCMAVWDVSRAHFYGLAERAIYTNLPEELAVEGFVAKLNKTMYGTQDAAHIWGETWVPLLESNGMDIGKSNRSVFGDEYRKGLCHGDDFLVVASQQKLTEFGKLLESKFDVRMSEMIGFGAGLGKTLKMLNRTIRVCDDKDCMELEADSKHVEQIVKDLGLGSSKAVDTPRVKMSVDEAQNVEATELLKKDDQTKFRSGTMRAAYLSQDRVDITEAVKCLARAMSSPREGHMVQLKRLGRYLKGRPKCVLQYHRQDPQSARLRVHTDSDWAGEAITRRSTSGMVVRRGLHLIRHSSTLQTSIGLSSAEAEYYAMTKGAAYGLGIQSLFRDWKIDLEIELYCDSSSARSFAKRRGLGKQRHIDTRYLWLQERVALKHLKVLCVRTDENPADLFTKCLSRTVMDKFVVELQQVGGPEMFRLDDCD